MMTDTTYGDDEDGLGGGSSGSGATASGIFRIVLEEEDHHRQQQIVEDGGSNPPPPSMWSPIPQTPNHPSITIQAAAASASRSHGSRSHRRQQQKKRQRQSRRRQHCCYCTNHRRQMIWGWCGIFFVILLITARIWFARLETLQSDETNNGNTTTTADDSSPILILSPQDEWNVGSIEEATESSSTTTTTTSSTLPDCHGSIIDDQLDTYINASTYFQQLAYHNITTISSSTLSSFMTDSSDSTNVLPSASSLFINVNACQLDCHNATIQRIVPQSNDRNRNNDNDDDTTKSLTTKDVLSVFRVRNGGQLTNCHVEWIFDDKDDFDDGNDDGNDDSDHTDLGIAGAICDDDDNENDDETSLSSSGCTISNFQCSSSVLQDSDDGNNVIEGDDSTQSLKSAIVSSCILVEARNHQQQTSNNVDHPKKMVRIHGGQSSPVLSLSTDESNADKDDTKRTPKLTHGIWIWMEGGDNSSRIKNNNKFDISISNFVIHQSTGSGIKIALIDNNNNSNDDTNSDVDILNNNNNDMEIRLYNVTSTHNGGDGLEVVGDDAVTFQLLIQGGIYNNNSGNGLNIAAVTTTNTASVSSSIPSSSSVVVLNTAVNKNRRNGIRIQTRTTSTTSSNTISATMEDSTPFQLAIDSVAIHDNQWFGIVVTDDNNDDDGDKKRMTKENKESVDSVVSDISNYNVNFVVTNSLVFQNGHDGLLVVAEGTNTTIEQSSFLQNGYYDDDDDEIDVRHRRTRTSSSKTSTPYGSGISIYNPFAVSILRTEVIDNRQNGIQIIDIKPRQQLEESSTQSSSPQTATSTSVAVLVDLHSFHNVRDGLLIVGENTVGTDESDPLSSPTVIFDNVRTCSNGRNGMTFFFVPSPIEIVTTTSATSTPIPSLVSCHNIDGWDYQFAGITDDHFEGSDTTVPLIVGSSCTNAIGEGTGGVDLCDTTSSDSTSTTTEIDITTGLVFDLQHCDDHVNSCSSSIESDDDNNNLIIGSTVSVSTNRNEQLQANDNV